MRHLVTLLLLASPVLAEDARQNPPDDAAIETAKQEVLAAFGPDIQKAKTAAAKKALVTRSLAVANEPREMLPTRWVLYAQARELAVAAGDVQLTSQSIDQLERTFQIKRSEIAADAAEKLVKVVFSTSAKALLDFILIEADAAVQADDYKSAVKMLTAGAQYSKQAKDALRTQRVQAHLKQANDFAKQFDEVQGDDERMGKFQCLHKGNWEKGLPFLSNAKDEGLANVAKKDQSKPADKAEHLEVGDGWFDQAEKAKGDERLAMLRRAYYWFISGVSGTSGLAKAKTASRMTTIINEVETADAKEGRFTLLAGRWRITFDNNWGWDITISALGRLDLDRTIAPDGRVTEVNENGYGYLVRKYGTVTAKKGELIAVRKNAEEIHAYRLLPEFIAMDRYVPISNFPKKVELSGKLAPLR